MEKKLEVLVYADSVLASTGFSTVSRNLLRILYATGKYNFTCIGINHDGSPYDQQKYPYAIHPAVSPLSMNKVYEDVYGRQKFIDFARTGNFDLVFMLQDTFIVESFLPTMLEMRDKLPKEKKFPIIYYFPIDGEPKKSWIENTVAMVDFPVTYTEYAKKECLKHVPGLDRMPIIYHGVDKSTFFPLPANVVADFRKQFFPKHSDKFIVLNVNRNQPRKDLHRTFAAFKLFHEKNPNTFLFINAQAADVGGNLLEIAEHYGLKYDEDWACPSGQFNANQGYPIEIVNQLYNACDLVASTSIGEGWGLSISEGMAVKKTVLFPRNTSMVEIIGENEEYGYLCRSGATINDWICLGMPDNNLLRPLTDVVDLSEKMCYIYEHQDEAKTKAELAYERVWTWEQVGEQWKDVFNKADIKKRILRGEIKPEVNSDCPCGSGIKFKKCCGR
jgi:glycosyltransferase involved in cell wall biosynthesis